jgi:hypothetical protein
LQQQREKIVFFVLMVQGRGHVEILADLADGLQHNVVAAVFGDIARKQPGLPAKAAHFVVAGIEHFYRLGKSGAAGVKRIDQIHDAAPRVS